MKQAHIHAIVLGAALILSSVILLVRVSHANRLNEGESPAVTAPTAKTVGSGASPASSESEEDKARREAEELMNEAQVLFKGAAGKEGREGELIEAKKLLHKAQELLEPLPREDEKVKALSTRLSGLLDDVLRVSGF